MSATTSFATFEVLPAPPGLDEEHPNFPPITPLRPDRDAYATAKPLAALTVPEQIATFSYDENHALRHDDTSVRYFVDPPAWASLDMGFEKWVDKEEDSGRLDSLLQAYARAVELGKEGEKPSVMTWRGMMTRILTALYEERDPWEMNAMLVDGTMYLEDNKGYTVLDVLNPTPHYPKPRVSKKIPDSQRRLMYTGYAFESYCTMDHPSAQAPIGAREPEVNTNLQWCSIVQTRLGPSKLILGGEVDCVRGKYTGKNGNYVELKTSGAIRSDRDARNFERKALKYWAQSYLLGIPEVIVGFRSAKAPYFLESVQKFETFSLTRIGLKAGWSASACLNWANAALQYIRQRIEEENKGKAVESTMFRVLFRPNAGIQAWALVDKHAASIQLADEVERIGFLPKEYYDWVMSRKGHAA
ncbi:RAI1-domain-containing protein [Calocera viscosa TUFC12733]|uniref:Decapping nuclease n=1 Tax=Calocera viscosa (strain TUFC12733) TaxID=1330018 RepID=A0A167QXZ5_CALVF|nr:RAI1-domain-containing protein [Calocera viscosa TUFC12733]